MLLLTVLVYLHLSIPSTLAFPFINVLQNPFGLSPAQKSSSALAPKHSCISSVPPISLTEFTTRQTSLADILSKHGAAAYIAEPSAQTQFFGNFSHLDWKLSERPLLLIITLDDQTQRNREGSTRAKVSLLTPKFEATRAKLLSIPSISQYIEWAEEENPYVVAAQALNLSSPNKTIYIDSSARHLHFDGFQEVLKSSSIVVRSAPKEVNILRERKSEAEIEILKCVNEATLLTIRHVHRQLYIGIRESEARSLTFSAFAEGGLSSGYCLILFGEDAALPHGSGTDKKLEEDEFALFDCGANLHGYWSDITRTMALPSSKIPPLHVDLWSKVHLVQQVAFTVARANIPCKTVDLTARTTLRALGGGYDQYFTHRLGHGIGLEGHESPYLNGGSEDIILPGHTFSDEPGIYIEGKVGIRLEDCFYIDSYGKAVYLTAGVGGPSRSPLKP